MSHRQNLAFRTNATERQPVLKQVQPSKRLRPLHETINGLQVYGNENGEKFTLRVKCYDKAVASPTYHVVLQEVSENPYCVLGTLKADYSAVFIQEIKNNGTSPVLAREKPPEDRKGYGFFSVILDAVMQIAMETGKREVAVAPDNKKLLAHYAQHGFKPDEDRPLGHMRLEVKHR